MPEEDPWREHPLRCMRASLVPLLHPGKVLELSSRASLGPMANLAEVIVLNLQRLLHQPCQVYAVLLEVVLGGRLFGISYKMTRDCIETHPSTPQNRCDIYSLHGHNTYKLPTSPSQVAAMINIALSNMLKVPLYMDWHLRDACVAPM